MYELGFHRKQNTIRILKNRCHLSTDPLIFMIKEITLNSNVFEETLFLVLWGQLGRYLSLMSSMGSSSIHRLQIPLSPPVVIKIFIGHCVCVKSYKCRLCLLSVFLTDTLKIHFTFFARFLQCKAKQKPQLHILFRAVSYLQNDCKCSTESSHIPLKQNQTPCWEGTINEYW